MRKELSTPTFPALHQLALSRGWELAGDGNDKTVYEKAGEAVAVFLVPPGNLHAARSLALFKSWIDYTKENPDLAPYVVKFGPEKETEIPTLEGTQVFMVRLERLEDLDPFSALALFLDYVEEVVLNTGGSLRHTRVELQEIEKALGEAKNEPTMKQRMGRDGVRSLTDLAPDEFWRTYLTVVNHKIRQADMHSGNIMLRGSTPVIVDPWHLWSS